MGYCNVVMSLSGLGEDQVDCGIEESNTRRLLYAIYILSTYAAPLSQANMTALPDPANLEAAVIETLIATTDMQVSEDGHFADPDSGGVGGAVGGVVLFTQFLQKKQQKKAARLGGDEGV